MYCQFTLIQCLLFKVWGMISHESKTKKEHFILLHLIFSRYYCAVDLKRRSDCSGRRPGTNSLVCYLGDFFSSQGSTFQITSLLYHFELYEYPVLKTKKHPTVIFFSKFWGLGVE